MTKDIDKFPGNQEQIGLDEKTIPENDGGQQTVLAGEYQERKEGAFTMAPVEGKEEDLMRPTSSSRTTHENEKREGADQRSTSKSASSPRDAKVWASHRASNATSLGSRRHFQQ